VRDYLEAHDRRDADAALSAFTPDAIVRDDGSEYHGSSGIREWLSRASVEFTYTRTMLGADEHSTNEWIVTNHLAGDFPGGEVDLSYRFVLRDGRISELEIAP
jgi:hypothetical protein